jgi:hypothetical protein
MVGKLMRVGRAMKRASLVHLCALVMGCGSRTTLDDWAVGIGPGAGKTSLGMGDEDGSQGGGGGGTGLPPCELPACSWPVSIDPPDISNVGWSVSRTLVVCGQGAEVTSTGSNDSTIACEDGGGCVIACGTHQYLLSLAIEQRVHGAAPSPPLVFPTLPAGCASPQPLVPSALAAFYCCPCE